jgi:uncharacterized protein YbjQ (UPF0145 family)
MTDLSTRAAQALSLGKPTSSPTSQASAALSTDEVLALAQVGYEPVAVVSGSAVARLGNFGEWSLRPMRNYEVPYLTRLLNGSRTRAITELRERCEELGANGVIGARINLAGIEHEGVATFVATGTAVRRIKGAESDPRGPHERMTLSGMHWHRSGDSAFTSALSGHDFHLLVRAGGNPMGFVVGASAFHFGWRSPSRWARSQGHCVELPTLTESLYGARKKAIERLQDHAAELRADGVVDTKVIERADAWGRHVIEFVAYGTAVAWDSTEVRVNAVGAKVMLNDTDLYDTGRAETFSRPGSDLRSLR